MKTVNFHSNSRRDSVWSMEARCLSWAYRGAWGSEGSTTAKIEERHARYIDLRTSGNTTAKARKGRHSPTPKSPESMTAGCRVTLLVAATNQHGLTPCNQTDRGCLRVTLLRARERRRLSCRHLCAPEFGRRVTPFPLAATSPVTLLRPSALR